MMSFLVCLFLMKWIMASILFSFLRVGRPVRCVLEREENIRIFGGRDPCKYKFKVGYTKEGKITALDIKLFADVGYTLDVSPVVSMKKLVNILGAKCIQPPFLNFNFAILIHIFPSFSGAQVWSQSFNHHIQDSKFERFRQNVPH